MSVPVVLLHGLGCSPRFWDDVVPVLTSAATAPPLPEVEGVAAKARELAAVVPTGAVVVGHSLGGMVAQELALLDVSPVRALVLCCTIPGASDSVRAHNLPAADLAERDGSAALADLMVPTLVGADQRRPGRDRAAARVREDLSGTAPERLSRDLRSICSFDARQRLLSLDLPALVVAGEGEPNLDEQRWLATALRAPFEVLPGTGHLAPAEDPAVFAALVNRFCASLEGAP